MRGEAEIYKNNKRGTVVENKADVEVTNGFMVDEQKTGPFNEDQFQLC